jgi:hypothetical protein
VFRLWGPDGDKKLVYSPVIKITDSSVPFRAYLGALISATIDFPVPQPAFPDNLALATLVEDPAEDDAVSPGDDDDRSGEYKPARSVNSAADPPMTCSRHRSGHDSELMVRFHASSCQQSGINGSGHHAAHVGLCRLASPLLGLPPPYVRPCHICFS